MRPRTILAVAFLAGATLVPRCASSRYRSTSIAPPPPPATEKTPSSSQMAPVAPVEVTAAAAPPAAAAVVDSPVATAPGADQSADPFRVKIRPILSEHCGACHDPGGKMYARLPFDDPKVVASHSEGVLRRLKGDDREALQRWIASLAPAGTQQ